MKFTNRKVVIVGGVVTSVAVFLAAFATDIYYIIVVFGGLTGQFATDIYYIIVVFGGLTGQFATDIYYIIVVFGGLTGQGGNIVFVMYQ